MKYDFETLPDRAGKDALAADVIPIPGASVDPAFSPISMWIADMNLPTAPCIQEEIGKRLAHPYFGYFNFSKEYYDSILRWQKSRNNVEITPEVISFENGVLGCFVNALQSFTAPGEKILAHSPCYVGFTGRVNSNGRVFSLSQLKQDENGIFRMDFEDMEQRLRDEHIHFAIFCNPHNPTGRVWEKWEIEKAMALYEKYDVTVFSDEIWSDIILEGYKHTPTQSVSEDAKRRTIAIYSLTKTFNLAGIPGAYSIIYNERIRDRVLRRGETNGFEKSVIYEHALIGGYSEAGEEWLEELRTVLSENVNYAVRFIEENFPGVRVSKPQGTYLIYLYVEDYLKAHPEMTMDGLLKEGVRVGVVWQDGRGFKQDNTIRMNLASPTSMVKEAFDRLKKYVFVP